MSFCPVVNTVNFFIQDRGKKIVQFKKSGGKNDNLKNRGKINIGYESEGETKLSQFVIFRYGGPSYQEVRHKYDHKTQLNKLM